jgi:hypothetical protein
MKRLPQAIAYAVTLIGCLFYLFLSPPIEVQPLSEDPVACFPDPNEPIMSECDDTCWNFEDIQQALGRINDNLDHLLKEI